MPHDFRLIRTRLESGVLWATVDHPPINLVDRALFRELRALAAAVETDDGVRVLVLESANPDFWLAHFDVQLLLDMPIEQPPQRRGRNDYLVMCERLRTMPKVTIAKIAGRLGGGANEIAASCDMRFGALGRAVLNQMEVSLGLLPGGTGTQRLPRLLGRGRALQMILGSDDVDAATAERWGFFNQALPAEEIDAFVDRLARRIASHPADSVALAKQSVLNTETMSVSDGLWEEDYLFQTLMRSSIARRRMQRFIDEGGQTRDGELRVAELVRRIAESDAAAHGVGVPPQVARSAARTEG
jgi:enoyl-CoA hydratase/carnithine racemase